MSRLELPLATALAGMCLLPTTAPAQDTPTLDPDAGYVQVSGTAQVDVPVDRARVRFAVETEAPDARTAVERNAELMDAVLAALRGLDVEGLDLETQGFELQPQYDRRQGENPTIRAYRARNHVAVTVDDVEAVGRVIDAGVAAGANRIASLSFEARDTEAARLEALRRAVEEARRQAEAMAAALGLPLGPPLEVNGGARVPSPEPYMARMEMAQAAPSTPVEAGDQTISASVTIKYRLGAGGGG
ncbi:MAG TPA: SIMPL domain-containing protein [Longimicrobiales bacterium]|nr:SIMPL domain-containing protein [Longimicrobiales bacterium]